MKQRLYEFALPIETSTQPDAGTPTLTNDLVTKGYADGAYGAVPQVNGLVSIGTSGLTYTHSSGKSVQVSVVKSTGGAVTVTNNPQISAGTTEGYMLILIGYDLFSYPIFSHGNGLVLNGECQLKENSILGLIWQGNAWKELFRNGV